MNDENQDFMSPNSALEENWGVQIHASVWIDADCQPIGKGTKIWHFTHVVKEASIGKHCMIGQNCFIAGVVGNRCKIQNGVSVFSGVFLADNVFVGPNAVFTNVLMPRAFVEQKAYTTTYVERGVTIGAGATIICGNKIGKYAFIGAGAVVTRDILSYAMVYGNPAKMEGWICKNGCKMRERHAKCPRCGVKND